METRHPPVRFSQRLISWTVCGLMVWQPVAPAVAAAITPNGQTGVDKAGNGVPVVNIATPNGAGISHNQFNDYNVGKEGLILNNATGQLNPTQLGGLIQNNPNLQAGREAKGIINEVTGGSRSQLQGYTEVAGKAANVMVANPYGITCNGCGFINTPNVTLTTGKPQFDANGNLLSLEVTKGAITVEGQGLDASKNDAVSLIARATEVNAAIHARELTVTVGANRVGADGRATAIAGEGAAPAVAVDTGALGGMYANRIRLVSSEKGVGVNLGNLNARQGDIQLDASGRLTVANTLASGTLTANGAGVTLSGSHQAGSVSVNSSQDLVLNNSTLASGGEMRLSSDGKLQMTGGGANSAGSLTVSSGQDAALANSSLVSQGAASLSSKGQLTVTGGGVSAQGGALSVSGKQGATLADATLVGKGSTTLATDGALAVRGGSLTSQGDLTVTAGQSATLDHAKIGSDSRTTLTSAGALTATASTLSAGNSLALKGEQLTLDDQSRADAAGDIRLEGNRIVNRGQANAGNALAIAGKHVENGGQLAAKGRLDLQTDTLNNGGTLQGNGVTVTGKTLTNGGTLQSAGQLTVSADTLNQQGTLSAKGDASVVANTALHNTGSTLADGALNVNAGTLAQDGTLSGATSLTAQAATLAAGKDSRTTSQGNVQLTVNQQAELNGQVDVGGALAVTANGLMTGRDAHLQSGQDLTLNAQNVELNGVQAAKGALNVSANALTHDGKSTGKTLSFTAADALKNGGELTADAVALDGLSITQLGVVKADGLTLRTPGFINNSGTLAAGALTLDGNAVTNSGLMQGSTGFNLKADTLTNLAGGAIYSVRDLTLNLPTLDNGGLITTDGTLRLKGTALENVGEINGVSLYADYARLNNLGAGRLLADDGVTLTGASLTNEGHIAAKNLNLTANGLQNTGTLESDDALTLNAATLTNGGTVRGGNALELRGNTLANRGEISATALLLSLSGQIDNAASGRLIARSGLTLTASDIVNSGLATGSDLTLNGGAITNDGTLQGTRLLTATGSQLTNQQAGMLLSGGLLDLQNAKITNGGLLQGKTLNLATGEWINNGNALGETGVTAKVSGAFSNQGKVLSQQAVDITAAATDNRGQLLAKVLTLRGDLQNSGLLQGSNALGWSGDTFVNQTTGKAVGGETLTLAGKTLANQGAIQARSATLGAQSLTNGGAVQALDALNLTFTGRLDNAGALLSQNLFELTAAQLFNDGQLAGKALTLSAAELSNSGILQGNDALNLTTRTLTNGAGGQLVSGGGLNLTLDTLDNAGLLLVNKDFTLRGSALVNGGEIQAQSVDADLSNALTNQGKLVAAENATLKGATLTNGGTLAGKTLNVSGTELRNRGLVQGSNAIDATASRFINELAGTWLSGGAMTLQGGQFTNAGAIQGSGLEMTGATLANGGTIAGLASLKGTFSGTLNNAGLLQSGGAMTLGADALTNPGRIMGDTLTLNARELNNGGLWQGARGLTVTGDTLTTGTASRTLTGGLLTLDAGQLATQGTLQGNGVDISANGWTHGGSLLSQGALTANVADVLTSTGSLMSQGGADIAAQTLDNRGEILGENGVTLGGGALKNSGTVQGKTLTLQQSNINNQGTLTGLQSLTIHAQQRLMARMAMAAPQQVLINGANGKLLTQGTLNVTSGDVTNAGSWQAQSVVLNAQSLANSGAVQSADGLQMTLANTLTATAGSKITALGAATLQAATLANQGQWAAKNLTLKGGTLSNGGEISGVNGLTLSQTGAVSQQQNGTMLTGGALNLSAASVTNDGKIQGGTLGVTTGALTNSGRLQGDSGGTLTLSGTLTNNAKGEIVSRQGLTVTTPTLLNYGLIQGGGETRLTATSQASNEGKLLSGAKLTLAAPQYTGAGWLQATDLILNAAAATNGGGTWIADRATLTGTTFTNQGTTQAGALAVNYNQLTNGGTLLGSGQLSIDADSVTQSAAGKLFSGGDLWLESKGINLAGQLVALGNLTLQLTNAFTANSAIAAGKTLTISSGGAIENRSVMQGQAVNLSAGGQLTNSGQITTGSGASTLSGSSVALNGAGTVQGGGDITVASRGNITVDGFTGTRGSLTLSAPGSIVNTALLYAANNLALYANSITNQRGDIMAGNSLWMQKDAAGNANSQVINTSGTIETQRGDINVRTNNLVNKRENIAEKRVYTANSSSPAAGGASEIQVRVSDLDDSDWGYYFKYSGSTQGGHVEVKAVPSEQGATQRYLIGSEVVDVTADGPAARIASGRNMTIQANRFENLGSNVLAQNNMDLSGATLNNQSFLGYAQDEYRVYKYTGKLAMTTNKSTANSDQANIHRYVSYYLSGIPEYSTRNTGQDMRSVINAGGTVNANFADNISNTATASNAGGVNQTIPAPALNTLSNQSIGSGAQKQALTSAGTVAVNSPQWQDQLQGALQQINGGGALDANGAANASLSNVSTTQKGDANLGSLGALANAGVTTAELNNAKGSAGGQYQGQRVDTSAYPLPSGNNGYFVFNDNPKSPYLISINPKLNDLGKLDPALFAELNAMLGIAPSSSAPQETRAAFTDEKQFLGSSYMLGRLNVNPDYDYRFLGDAAFDTRYVSNVVLNQTGSRYLNGIGTDLDQMRYLMDNAAASQQSLGLQFGVSLTADQIAALDRSMLWWEKTTINGEVVMVPKVYLSPKDVTVNNGSVIAGNNVNLKGGNIINSGSTLLANNGLTLDSQNSISNLNDGLMKAGGDLNLNAIGDINNISSTISGKAVALESKQGNISNLTQVEQIAINGKNVNIEGTLVGKSASIVAQDTLSLGAGKNVTVTGASLASGADMLISAWGDIAINANEINDSFNSNRFTTGRTSVAVQGSTLTSGGGMVLQAGRDINAQAAAMAAEKNVGLQAGRDVNLEAEATTQGDSYKTKKKTVINESVRQQGTAIASGGNTVIIAGRDVTTEAAQVTAKGDIGVAAGRDVNLNTATESDYAYKEETKTKKGFLSKKTTHTIQEDSATREAGTLLSGDKVQVAAGNNLLVKGSAVVGDGEVGLAAGNNVDIVAATNSDTSWRFKEEKKSGLMGTGGIGFTIGSSKSTHDLRESGTTQSQSFSTVGSTGGDVVITAGNQLHVGGADLIAGKDMSLTGDSVMIEPGHDKRTRDETFEQKASGLTVALSGAVGSAINSAVTTAQEVSKESDGRLAALQATKAALSGVQAVQGEVLAQQTGDPANGFGVSVSLTTQKSKSQQHAESDTVAGSTLNAGNDLAITATGKGKSANSGDILIGGSQLKAGGDAALSAENDILLTGAANTQKTSGKNSSSGGGVGVSIGGGSGGAGISVFANVNAAKGKDKGNGTAWTETTLDSGGTVTMTSGRDAILNGAQVNGDKIVADIGRDLWMTSQQDSNDYNSKQTSVAAGGSFTFGSMTGSGYISASQDKMKSTFDSVQEQTGLFAGDGGFDITVGRHTQLDGAVIASTGSPDKNSLDTGTLGFSDLHNEADYKVSHTGISLSGSKAFGDPTKAASMGGMIAGASHSGHAEGTTQAAVADGSITVRDQANQKQDVASLSRDTENANDSISPIFDKEKEQNRLKAVGLISDIGSQAVNIAQTQGEINALDKARETYPNKSVKELRETDIYRKEQEKYGTGSDIQRGIQAATAALQGLAGGNMAGALAGASAPQLAHMLKETEGDPAVNTLAHAILGGAVAAIQGNSAAAGAAGAASGELAAHAIASMLYPDVKSLASLSEEQKQTVSILASISAGMAGGLAGNSAGSVTAGAQAGKNAVENNGMSQPPLPNGMIGYINGVGSWNQYAEDSGMTPEEKQAAMNKYVKGDMPDSTNITKTIVEGYQDGTMLLGAGYMGTAVTIGRAVGSGALAEAFNAGYQWYDLSQPGNENKSWDYKGSISAGVSGMLAPGRTVVQNVGISVGSAFFNDGADMNSLGSAAVISWAGGTYSELSPFPGVVNDILTGAGGEFIGNKLKDKLDEKK